MRKSLVKKGSLHIARVERGQGPLEVVFEAPHGERKLRALAPSAAEHQRWMSQASQLLATCAAPCA